MLLPCTSAARLLSRSPVSRLLLNHLFYFSYRIHLGRAQLYNMPDLQAERGTRTLTQVIGRRRFVPKYLKFGAPGMVLKPRCTHVRTLLPTPVCCLYKCHAWHINFTSIAPCRPTRSVNSFALPLGLRREQKKIRESAGSIIPTRSH